MSTKTTAAIVVAILIVAALVYMYGASMNAVLLTMMM